MPDLFLALLASMRSALLSHSDLALENLALRQQLAVLRRTSKRPPLHDGDRRFWIILSRVWIRWRDALALVKPDTVVKWHRQGFRFYWGRKAGPGPGRPRVPQELRDLIRQTSEANPMWGAPKIHGELLMLGLDVSEATVSRYMVRTERRLSQTWKVFLDNHLRDVVAVDFFSVPTATFRVLFVFVVLAHDRRRILHFNVTDSPTAEWTGRQVLAAFPWTDVPRYLLRDGAGDYGLEYRDLVESLGIQDLVTSPASPWQNGYVERVIGSIRRECLEHVIILNEKHLSRILARYVDYYNRARTHLSLDKNSPDGREIEPRSMGG